MNPSESDFLKYRWEFIRRNPDYKDDYEKVLRLRKMAEEKAGVKISKDHDSYCKTQEFKNEMAIIQKWGVKKMWSPSESYDEISGLQDLSASSNADSANRVLKWARGQFKKHEAEAALNESGLSCGGLLENPSDRVDVETKSSDDFGWTVSTIPSGYRYFQINVDFEKIRSLENLKSAVCAKLEMHYHNYKKKAGKKLYLADFDIILEVGDLKEAGWTNQKIAKKIYPRLFENKDANHESTIRNISHIYKRYKELVAGGYKHITYP
jgi:hypothetical protein